MKLIDVLKKIWIANHLLYIIDVNDNCVWLGLFWDLSEERLKIIRDIVVLEIGTAAIGTYDNEVALKIRLDCNLDSGRYNRGKDNE